MTSESGKRLALVGSSVLLTLLVVELGVRLLEPREVLREYFETSDPVLNHRFRRGARGHQKTMESMPSTLDRARLAQRWSVVNAGVASYSPLLEYLS